MARNQGWKFFLGLVLGIGAASLFWLYGPFFDREGARRRSEAPNNKPLLAEVGSNGRVVPKGLPAAAVGKRYQLVSDGKQTFLADLEEGRVWRYYHYTREEGHLKEEEGFLPLPFYWGGRKVFSAGEVDAGSKREERRGRSETGQ